jgi:hypothetical protein
MTVEDPGHTYTVKNYDGHGDQTIRFMKRDATSHPDGCYPGNEGSYPGTNIQEVLRVMIDRVKYLDNQIPCDENLSILDNLRRCLVLLEDRAAQRHGKDFPFLNLGDEVESIPTCEKCGHWFCGKHGTKA